MKAWEATLRKTQTARKRANSIFGTTSVAHADDIEDDDEGSCDDGSIHEISAVPGNDVYQAERFLPNGDCYTGQWYDIFPHGHGKYLWTDGCSYIGEWSRGKTMGKGRFSWPSGAVYQGEFKNGYMDGQGTYTGPSGDVYRGQWTMNMKHGHGIRSYVNGDRYEGDWRRGLQEGKGKYQWVNENCYVGEWKNGVISGRGKFVWSNGYRYEGYWEDGLPKGSGTYRWPDGSFYTGNWSKDPDEQNGTFYPAKASVLEGNLDWSPNDVFTNLRECIKICPGEKVTILPSQKKLAVWRSSKSGEGGKPRRASVDGRASVGLERTVDRMRGLEGGVSDDDVIAEGNIVAEADMFGMEIVDVNLVGGSRTPSHLKVLKAGKRQGETICKGHKNYELMLNLQLGIRYIISFFLS